MKRSLKLLAMALTAIVLIGGTVAWFHNRTDENAAAFKTVDVKRGDLSITISATGTVEPEEVIDVGAQVAGKILSFGKDVDGHPVDYGSRVVKGTVLARIDESLYATDVASTQAQVKAAQAGVERAEADLEQYQAKLNQAQRDWRRAQKLGPSEALSQTSYDAYRSTYESAKANVAVGHAAISQAKADLLGAQAAWERAKRNLGYCVIKSPVKGVIIDRRVNIGQTVVSSLNAPSLFLIAKDLTHMQVWVAVNEADIGKIHPGLPVRFTVDAFPDETFRGTVGKVRLNAAMTQNVVTYTVEITTNNENGRLLPYLTANVQFELRHLTGVLQVPNVALRWMPEADQVDPQFRDAGQDRADRAGGAGAVMDTPAAAGAEMASDSGRPRILWTLDGAYVRPIRVRAGASDGIMTEVTGRDLAEGMPIVIGLKTPEEAASDARNPFTPNFGHRGRSRKSH